MRLHDTNRGHWERLLDTQPLLEEYVRMYFTNGSVLLTPMLIQVRLPNVLASNTMSCNIIILGERRGSDTDTQAWDLNLYLESAPVFEHNTDLDTFVQSLTRAKFLLEMLAAVIQS